MANDGRVRVPWAVRVEGLRRVLDGRVVVDGLRLDVRPGEFVALIGSGGRSAPLRILAGLDRDVEGTVLAAVPQSPRLRGGPADGVGAGVAGGVAGPRRGPARSPGPGAGG